MNNPLKAISYKKKYGKVVGQLVELLAERDALQKEIRELNYKNISLELEVKRQTEIAQNTHQAAVLIARQNSELKKENTTLKIRNNIIEHREVRENARTQSSGCGA